ncbi:phosphoribosyltransferase [Candidatus Microgenomates bacterium]|nr:phosphoribosyltransferase [Candidatus Microgenomates bacterium]
MKRVVFGSEKYLTPSWDEMGSLCFALAQKILKSKQNYDRLVALAKGGLTWSRTLVDYLKIPKISTFQIKFYKGLGKTKNRPIIVQSLPATIEGEKILVFDDVADSGETLKTAKEYLKMCGAKSVCSATLFIKSWVKTKPDFYAGKTDAWIIFPHEIREIIELLSLKWSKKGISKKEIKSRLSKLNLPQNQVEYFIIL